MQTRRFGGRRPWAWLIIATMLAPAAFAQSPATISFPSAQTRKVPAITAVDGVSITGAGGFGTTFYGTSASVPHVAAICALMKQACPKATPAMIRFALHATATDKGTSGFDTTYGDGVIDALSAVKRMMTVAKDAAGGWRLYP